MFIVLLSYFFYPPHDNVTIVIGIAFASRNHSASIKLPFHVTKSVYVVRVLSVRMSAFPVFAILVASKLSGLARAANARGLLGEDTVLDRDVLPQSCYSKEPRPQQKCGERQRPDLSRPTHPGTRGTRAGYGRAEVGS